MNKTHSHAQPTQYYVDIMQFLFWFGWDLANNFLAINPIAISKGGRKSIWEMNQLTFKGILQFLKSEEIIHCHWCWTNPLK